MMVLKTSAKEMNIYKLCYGIVEEDDEDDSIYIKTKNTLPYSNSVLFILRHATLLVILSQHKLSVGMI